MNFYKYIKEEVVEYRNKCTEQVVVSVCILTYNHAKFIGACLDAVLKQKVSFGIEILIGEDESRDETRAICLTYAEKHPDKIRLFLHSRRNVIYLNGKPSGRFNLLYNLLNAKGKYIAVCEGDDLWIDEYKLQKQVDFMESHPRIAGCFHNAIVVDANGNELKREWFDETKRSACDNKTRFSRKDCLMQLQHMYPTCSVLFRTDTVRQIPSWALKVPNGDYMLDLLITRHGDLEYLPMNMAAYRIHSGGVWQGATSISNQMAILRTFRVLYSQSELGRQYPGYLKEEIIKRAVRCYQYYRHRNKIFFVGYLLLAIRYGLLKIKFTA